MGYRLMHELGERHEIEAALACALEHEFSLSGFWERKT